MPPIRGITSSRSKATLALHTLYTDARGRWEENSLEFGPVLQTDVGRTQLNANVFWERSFGTLALGSRSLAWQAAYLLGSTYAQHGRLFSLRVKLDF